MENKEIDAKNKFMIVISSICAVIVFLIIFIKKGDKNELNENDELNEVKENLNESINEIKQTVKNIENVSSKKLDEFNKKVEEKLNGKRASKSRARKNVEPTTAGKKEEKGTPSGKQEQNIEPEPIIEPPSDELQ